MSIRSSLSSTEKAILRSHVKRSGGYTVKAPNARKTSRDSMAKLRSRGLVVYDTRNGWAGNWLTTAGLDLAIGLENPRRNPDTVLIYGRVLRVEAQKTQGHICDAGCKKAGHRYFHNFRPGVLMYGLPNKDLLLTKRKY